MNRLLTLLTVILPPRPLADLGGTCAPVSLVFSIFMQFSAKIMLNNGLGLSMGLATPGRFWIRHCLPSAINKGTGECQPECMSISGGNVATVKLILWCHNNI